MFAESNNKHASQLVDLHDTIGPSQGSLLASKLATHHADVQISQRDTAGTPCRPPAGRARGRIDAHDAFPHVHSALGRCIANELRPATRRVEIPGHSGAIREEDGESGVCFAPMGGKRPS